MDKTLAEKVLKEKFKIDSFRDGQWEIIKNCLEGKKTLLIAKTGYGKSLCYQFPAIMFRGITIVISPLIALMRDQVKKLNENGIRAASIHSNHSTDKEENEKINNQILEEALLGNIKVLYIAPERQGNLEWQEYLIKMNISMVVVDEAHCISVWGHDFRPDYRKIVEIIKRIPKKIPVLAVTATADNKIAIDIFTQMKSSEVDKIEIVKRDLFRDNLSLNVIKVKNEEEKMVFLRNYLNKVKGNGIIYSATKAGVEKFQKWLEYNKITSAYYHSQIGIERVSIENKFMKNEYKCIVATNSLGMGIDKKDIRYIIHTEFPSSPIHYYQEIGRAGRDDKKSQIILLYCENDLKIQNHFIEQGRPKIEKYEKVINAIKEEALTERQLIKNCNIKTAEFRVIKADLIDQSIIREISKKYEYNPNAEKLNISKFQQLRDYKSQKLKDMIEYININSCRMNFLCNYLDNDIQKDCGICDNDLDKKIEIVVTEEDNHIFEDFYTNFYYPVLEVEGANSIMMNGTAGGYYGISLIGESIHKSKYENGGDFSDYLLEKTYKAFKRKFKNTQFDMAIFVPPTKSGDLVKNFSEKLCKMLNITLSYNLIKIRETKEQKIFQNAYNKEENIKNAFYYKHSSELIDKTILIIDDIYDSGKTIKEIGLLLKNQGAKCVAPITIAKTIGGDI